MGIISGDWEIEVDFIRRSARHGASLNQQGPVISGRNRTQYGEREVGGGVEGEEIVMSDDIRHQGIGATNRFTGRSRGEDGIEGEVDLGEYWRRGGRAAGSEPQYRAAASTVHSCPAR